MRRRQPVYFDLVGGAVQIADLGPPRLRNPIFWLLVIFALTYLGAVGIGALLGLYFDGAGIGRTVFLVQKFIVDHFALTPEVATGGRQSSNLMSFWWAPDCHSGAIDQPVMAARCQRVLAMWQNAEPHEARPYQFLTYMFLHGSVAHLVLNSLVFAYLGPPVLRRMGVRRFLLFFVVCGLAGGLTYVALGYGLDLLTFSLGFSLGESRLPFESGTLPLVGASGAIFGIWLANMRITFDRLKRMRPRMRPVMLEDYRRRVWIIILGINLAFILLPIPVSGEAHMGGAIAGFFLAPMFYRKPAEYARALRRYVHAPLLLR